MRRGSTSRSQIATGNASYDLYDGCILAGMQAPGMTETRLSEGLTDTWKARKLSELPIRRFGVPNDIAPTAVLLASSDGDFYVGQTLSPNGGDVLL